MRLAEIIDIQRNYTYKAFGQGENTARILNHIMDEVAEVSAVNGKDVFEWCDIIILALDGAIRQGFSNDKICTAVVNKMLINQERSWPDPSTLAEDQPINHI
jgi:hypothetical protein